VLTQGKKGVQRGGGGKDSGRTEEPQNLLLEYQTQGKQKFCTWGGGLGVGWQNQKIRKVSVGKGIEKRKTRGWEKTACARAFQGGKRGCQKEKARIRREHKTQDEKRRQYNENYGKRTVAAGLINKKRKRKERL